MSWRNAMMGGLLVHQEEQNCLARSLAIMSSHCIIKDDTARSSRIIKLYL